MSDRKIAPSAVTHLHAVSVLPMTVSLAWTAPAVGTPPIRYTVFMRPYGNGPWDVVDVGLTACAATIGGLHPASTYEFEILAYNW